MIKILDYGMGNCGSIHNMLRHLGADCEVVTQAGQLQGAAGIVLPGVGSFDHGIMHLAPFREALEQHVINDKVPFLGVCLGMQLLLEGSAEGTLPGLGWISGEVTRFDFSESDTTERLVIPHMGWNEVWSANASPLLENTKANSRDRFYFVHSFHAHNITPENVMARCHYGYDFVCAIQKGNILGVQFHPEKSHKFGKQLFKKFVELSQC